MKIEWHKSRGPVGGNIYDASYEGFQMTIRRARCGNGGSYMLTVWQGDKIPFKAYFRTLAAATLGATAFVAGYEYGQGVVFARL